MEILLARQLLSRVIIFLLARKYWLYLSVLEKAKVICDISKKQK